jgi:trehalose-phosphatase
MTRSVQNVLLFLDYDGTLVPIKKRPELALLPASKKKILRDLSEQYFLAIVTGRALKDIKTMLRIGRAAYIGNHGLEIFYQGKYWVHPKAEKISFTLKNILKKLQTKLRPLQGAWIEDKTLTASIHYRSMLADKKSILKNMVAEEIVAAQDLLKCTEGKKVFEIRPNIDWNKGRGICKLLQWITVPANSVKIYVGDDATDEDAFQVFNKGDIIIRVGKKKKTHALHCFSSVSSVWKFLAELNQLQ